jgi:hypothetical protein
MGFPGLLLVVCMIMHMLLRNMRYGGAVVSIAITMIVITSMTEAILYGPMTRSHTVIWLIALFWQQMGMQRDVEKPMRRVST